jgi:ketosteroid isomerase-like protein
MKITRGLVFCFMAAAAFAQEQNDRGVLDAERKGCLAYQNHDTEGVREFLTDDYTLTDSHGQVTTKQDDLDDFLKDRIRYSTFENKNMKVRLYPGVAIVTGQTIVKGIAKSVPFDVEVQFTDTLVWLNGRWQLAAGHVSRLPAKK